MMENRHHRHNCLIELAVQSRKFSHSLLIFFHICDDFVTAEAHQTKTLTQLLLLFRQLFESLPSDLMSLEKIQITTNHS